MAKPGTATLQTGDSAYTNLVAEYPLISDLTCLVSSDTMGTNGGGSVTYPTGPEGPQAYWPTDDFLITYGSWLASLGPDGTNGFAIGFWYDATAGGQLFELYGDGNGTNPIGGIMLEVNSSYVMPAGGVSGVNPSYSSISISSATSGDSYIIIVWDGVDVDVYVDGSLAGSLTLSGGSGSVGASLRIQSYGGSDNYGAAMALISLRAWDAALTGTQISDLHSDWWSLITAGGGGSTVSGSGTGSVTTGGSATARVTTRGAGTGAVTTGGSAAPALTVREGGTSGVTTGGSALGGFRVAGAGAGAATTGETATGRVVARGSGTSGVTTGGSASPALTARGGGTSSVATGEAAAPALRARSSGTGAVTTGGSAAPALTVRGGGTSSVTTGGTADGRAISLGGDLQPAVELVGRGGRIELVAHGGRVDLTARGGRVELETRK